jgi:hypothetical protein
MLLLLQVSVPDVMADIVSSSSFQSFMQLAAANLQLCWRRKQQLQQQQQRVQTQTGLRQQSADVSPSDVLAHWALHRLLQLELIEMQPIDTDLVLQLLRYAETKLVGGLADQQQQQQHQEAVVLLQHVRQVAQGFVALQQGIAGHPAAVRSKARFAQHEQQQLRQAGWDSFTLDWDICSGKWLCNATLIYATCMQLLYAIIDTSESHDIPSLCGTAMAEGAMALSCTMGNAAFPNIF